MNPPSKPVLLTGAAGVLGRSLVGLLAPLGWPLRLTDIAPFPDPLPAGVAFVQADLADQAAFLRLAEGCGTILHFGGVSVEEPFETVLGPNIQGIYTVYEAARREGARMVFASSNHVAGFHERTAEVGPADPFRPDGYYGLSKAYGELMGRLYWDKHQVSSIFLRIGSCRPAPTDARMLATWLSHEDLGRLVIRSTVADFTGCLVIWGASNNAGMTWWTADDRDRIGWAPLDSADGYAALLQGVGLGDAVAERFQGGPYCAARP